jgi:hypothetical protein
MMNGSLAVAVPAWNDGPRVVWICTAGPSRLSTKTSIGRWVGSAISQLTPSACNSAQLFAAASKQAPIAAAIEQADHAPLLAWLQLEVHTLNHA